MASATTSIPMSLASRIDWCRRQSRQACRPCEAAGWQAEEDGLWDALLDRDHTNRYQQSPTGVFARYTMGLQDGHAMMRTAAVDQQIAIHAQRTHV